MLYEKLALSASLTLKSWTAESTVGNLPITLTRIMKQDLQKPANLHTGYHLNVPRHPECIDG